jgi:membrane protein DedA with SNARE-associated domain
MALGGTVMWLIGLICAVWVIYDVLTNQKKMDTGMKILWIVLALIFSIITAIIYYFVVAKKK